LDSVETLRRHTYSVFATLAVLAIFAVGLQVGDLLSRLLLVMAILGLLFLAPVVQYIAKCAMKKTKLWGRPVVVLSYRDAGRDFVRLLESEWELGYDPVALFDYPLMPAGEFFEEASYEETLSEAVGLARKQGVDTIIFAMPYTRREQLASMVSAASERFRHVLVVPNLSGITNSAVVARDLAGTFAVEIKYNLLDSWAQRAKRALDLFGAAIGGLLICPLLVTVALLIKLDSPGPAMFVQERPGLNGSVFRIFKFRTMYNDAEQRLAQLSLENLSFKEEFEEHGKLKADPRVTRVGRWLRKFSLDELPQLWNVLKGEMSLIGPRPYLISQRSQISDSEKFILRVPPGISGLWQVNGRSDATLEQRVGLDVYYVRNWSAWLDLVILARTAKCVILGRGAY
jgi:Undecaprenyl-phosphate galactose phosphotransferase WbaP